MDIWERIVCLITSLAICYMYPEDQLMHLAFTVCTGSSWTHAQFTIYSQYSFPELSHEPYWHRRRLGKGMALWGSFVGSLIQVS